MVAQGPAQAARRAQKLFQTKSKAAVENVATELAEAGVAGGSAPAVRYHYSTDRRGERPCGHLARFRGVLQADGYSGFGSLYDGDRVCEGACWAHVRRKFYDIDVAQQSLCDIERQINGKPPDLRRTVRQTEARPLIEALHR
jgi:transposase